MKAILVLILSSLISCLLPAVSMQDQQSLYASLLQISSIILAITGAWAAIIYPGALTQILKNNQSNEKMQDINNLIKPMKVSLIILASIIVLQLVSFIISIMHFSGYILLISQKICFSAIIYLYFLQIYSIVLAFFPISKAKRIASFEHKKNDLIDEVNKQ